MKANVSAIIAAAGAGTRFGGPLPKVYLDLCGQPVLAWSLQAFDVVSQVTHIVVAAAPEHLQRATDISLQAGLTTDWTVVAGGVRRQDTVRAALDAADEREPDIVCIHDGARPLVTPDIITAGIEQCQRRGASVACVPLTDTVKVFAENDSVAETLDRQRLRAIQTPQTFKFDLIREAHEHAVREQIEGTDDGALVEACGYPVFAAAGARENLKVTEPEDLAYAEWMLRRRMGLADSASIRVGHGYDLHRLAKGRRLVLCGVELDYDRGLMGHSDGDAALHAVADAILGATGLQDIGHQFPDTAPEFKDADSGMLLAQIVRMAAGAGWAIGNVDLTIIAQEPRISPYHDCMVGVLANILGVPASHVSVKATTNEGVGPVGEGVAIACHAVVTIGPQAQIRQQ